MAKRRLSPELPEKEVVPIDPSLINDLPIYVHDVIFEYFSLDELKAFSLVCQLWADISRSYIAKRVKVRLQPEMFEWIERYETCLRPVSTICIASNRPKFLNFEKVMQYLRFVDPNRDFVQKIEFWDTCYSFRLKEFFEILCYSSNLNAIEVDIQAFSDLSLKKSVEMCRGRYDFPNVSSLSIGSKQGDLEIFAGYFENLREMTIRLRTCLAVKTSRIVNNFGRIRHLVIGGHMMKCSDVDTMCQTLHSLKKLELIIRKQVKYCIFEFLKLPQIECFQVRAICDIWSEECNKLHDNATDYRSLTLKDFAYHSNVPENLFTLIPRIAPNIETVNVHGYIAPYSHGRRLHAFVEWHNLKTLILGLNDMSLETFLGNRNYCPQLTYFAVISPYKIAPALDELLEAPALKILRVPYPSNFVDQNNERAVRIAAKFPLVRQFITDYSLRWFREADL